MLHLPVTLLLNTWISLMSNNKGYFYFYSNSAIIGSQLQPTSADGSAYTLPQIFKSQIGPFQFLQLQQAALQPTSTPAPPLTFMSVFIDDRFGLCWVSDWTEEFINCVAQFRKTSPPGMTSRGLWDKNFSFSVNWPKLILLIVTKLKILIKIWSITPGLSFKAINGHHLCFYTAVKQPF